MLVFTERDVFSLSLVPFDEQIRELLGHDRVEEALLLLDGVQSYYPLDSYKVKAGLYRRNSDVKILVGVT